MLASLSMLGPFSVDAYLPAFTHIEASLHASSIEVQQTLTAYMLSFGVMILWHGALSDSFGRRNVVLTSLAVFAVATLGCAAAHSVHYLWAFRILQGISAGGGVVIGRAIIRDCFEGAEASRLLSMVTMIFSIAPAIAPILGGWIVQVSDWRTIFLALFAYTVFLFVWCYRKLPESLPPEKRQPFNPRVLAASYERVFRSPLFHLKAGAIGFNFAGLFLYISSAPVFVIRHLKLGEGDFGWLFIPFVSGMFLGSLAANRFAGKWSIPRQARLGFAFLLVSACINVAFHLLHPPMLPWSVATLFFYAFGMSIVAPGATLMVLDLFPNIRGVVASCQSFTVTILASVVSGILAPALSFSVPSLALGQLGATLIALIMWIIARHPRFAHPVTASTE